MSIKKRIFESSLNNERHISASNEIFNVLINTFYNGINIDKKTEVVTAIHCVSLVRGFHENTLQHFDNETVERYIQRFAS